MEESAPVKTKGSGDPEIASGPTKDGRLARTAGDEGGGPKEATGIASAPSRDGRLAMTSGGGTSDPSATALTRDGGQGGLIGILKGLEIEKSLATDPVVVALRYYPATQGTYAPLPPDLSPKLVEYLHGRGLDSLYTHQRAAYDLAKAGKSFVVTTPTASGKTLC